MEDAAPYLAALMIVGLYENLARQALGTFFWSKSVNPLSQYFLWLMQFSAEVERLESEKVLVIKDIVLKKCLDLEEICLSTHLLAPPDWGKDRIEHLLHAGTRCSTGSSINTLRLSQEYGSDSKLHAMQWTKFCHSTPNILSSV